MNMNKKTIIILSLFCVIVGLIVCLKTINNSSTYLATTPVAEYVAENPCDEDSIRRVLKIIGYVLLIAKVAVPLIIIGFGTVDLFKSVVDKDEKSLGKQLKQLGIRIIAGIIVFFIPTFINAFFQISDTLNVIETDQFKTCASCLLEPTNDTKCSVND